MHEMHDGISGSWAWISNKRNTGERGCMWGEGRRRAGGVWGSVSCLAHLFYTDVPISFFKFTGSEKLETQTMTRLIFSSSLTLHRKKACSNYEHFIFLVETSETLCHIRSLLAGNPHLMVFNHQPIQLHGYSQ